MAPKTAASQQQESKALVEHEAAVTHTDKGYRVSESLMIAGIGGTSYVFCAYVASVTRDKQYSSTYFAQTDPLSYYWPLSAFVTALMMNMLTLAFERGNVKRQLALLACYINVLAASSDLINLKGWAHLREDTLGYTFNLNRQIMWLHTTPVMVYLLSIFSDFRPARVTVVMMADVMLVCCAMSAQICSNLLLTAMLVAVASCMFAYVMLEMWRMFDTALASSKDSSSSPALAYVRMFTVGLWLVFPGAWLVVHTGILSPFMEEWVWSVGDVIGKVAFSSSLVLSNFLTMDQRRLIAMHAVEQTNRLQVISELKTLVEQKERFLSSMTHELRTPLNGIIGLSDAMLVGSCGQLNDTANRTLTTIKNSGLRLLNLINDILDAAAMRKGKLIIKQEKVDLHHLVDDVIELCQPLAKKRVKLVNNVSTSLAYVLGDTGRIIQIFYNLIGNSCKFTHQGYIAVSASQKGDMVEIFVSDTGIGIPEKNFDSVFNEFEQVDMSTTRKYGGTGLGLNLVQQLVHAHNGRITLTSELEKGTTFVFTLPVYSAAAAEAAHLAEQSATEEAAVGDVPALAPEPTSQAQPVPQQQAAGVASGVSAPVKPTTIPKKPALITLADDKGGELTSNDKPGFGRHVKKALVTVASASAAAVAASSAKAPSKPFYWSKYGKVMVLSVDDDPTNQMVIENLLTPAGYVVHQAMDGEEALKFLNEEPCLPDIVLLDVRMPGMSGYDVCKNLRRMFPDCFIPVIMVSAQTSEEEIVEGLLSGSNDYVTKPFGRQALLARIKSHLQVKHWVYHAPKEGGPPTGEDDDVATNSSHSNSTKQGGAAGNDNANTGNSSTGAASGSTEIQSPPRISKRRLLTPPSILAPASRKSLPDAIVEKLKGDSRDAVVEHLPSASVVVWNVRNAKEIGQHVNTDDFLAAMSDVAMQCDALLQQHNMYAADVTAGTWVAVAGLPGSGRVGGNTDASSAKQAAAFAEDLLRIVGTAKLPEGAALQLAVGIHTGPVSAMVVGLHRPQVQFSGVAVYTAALLQSAAPQGCVHISAHTAALLGDVNAYLPASATSMLLKAGRWEDVASQLPEQLGNFTIEVNSLREAVLQLKASAATPLQQALQLLTQTWPNSLWDSATLVEAPPDVRQLQAHRTALEQQLAEVTEEANRLQELLEKLDVDRVAAGGINASEPTPEHLVSKISMLESEVMLARQDKDHLQQKLNEAVTQLGHAHAQLDHFRNQVVLEPVSPSKSLSQLPYGTLSLDDRIAALKQSQCKDSATRFSPSPSPRISDRLMVASNCSNTPSRRSSYNTSDLDGLFFQTGNRRKPTLHNVLEEAGLLHLADMFEVEDITLELLPQLGDDDLKALGITKVGARARLKAICKHLANLPEVSEEQLC